ncbi:MAG: malto-oligosyltrehalose trehalohydrolase [Gordonia sp. (in: high G+C Gram-positive bacteria)]
MNEPHRTRRLDGSGTTPPVLPGEPAEIRVWAPAAARVHLVLAPPGRPEVVVPMLACPDTAGWWVPDPLALASAETADAVRYGFLIDDAETPVPDPRAARLPDGVHGLAQLHRVDPAIWHDEGWRGRDVRGAVIYELHIGTFTPEGTLDSAIGRLDDLVDLGVDFVEPLPLNAFNGVHGWGYDGVGWYAVHEPYGGPDALARFVDAAHTRGLGVILDVVYNHLGPSGNYLPDFGPYLGAADTGWGAAVNLSGPDSDEVRLFLLENALRWFAEFHVDGLRLDAVHALVDHRAVHVLEALATATDRLSAELGRPLSLIAESDLNDPRMITPRTAGGLGLTAQWDDDIHHAIHTLVSGERQGYYSDFGSAACLAKVLRGGFFHDGTYSSFRGRHHGRPMPATLPATTLLAYTCDHDQIGNRALGDRPSGYLDDGQLAIKAALVLLGPFTPMLFMGEEWAARTPFCYFTSHPEPELGEAVRTGRRAEFAAHGWASDDVPDPQDPATFRRSRLDWSERENPPQARVLDFYRTLIRLRKSEQAFTADDVGSVATEFADDAGWFAMLRGGWAVVCILADHPVEVPLPLAPVVMWETPESTDTGFRSAGHNVVIGRIAQE